MQFVATVLNLEFESSGPKKAKKTINILSFISNWDKDEREIESNKNKKEHRLRLWSMTVQST